jgi:hypothetical protein
MMGPSCDLLKEKLKAKSLMLISAKLPKKMRNLVEIRKLAFGQQ